MSKSKLSASRSSTRSRMGKGQQAEDTDDTAPPEVPQLSWKILGEKDVKELSTLSIQDVTSKLAKVLCLQQHEESLQEAALLDYYVAGYWFSREHKFSEEQTSAFFTLLHHLMDNLKVKQLSLPENVKELQKVMVGVGVSNETALRCFTKDHALLAVQYVTSSLFQHYRLFGLLFTEEQEEEVISTKLSVCLPPNPTELSPPPLEEGVPMDMYQRCMAPAVVDETQGGSQDRFDVKEDLQGDPSLKVSPEDVKAVMEKMAEQTLSSYQAQVSQRLRDKEQSIVSKLSQLEQNLSA